MDHQRARRRVLVALAATLCAGTAAGQSSVTIYGQADMFVGAVRAPGTSSRAFVADSGGMQTSYWGIKGAEDLGGGLRTVFDLNGFYRTDGGRTGRFDGDAMFSRNAYVGLESDKAGSLKIGRTTAPYFISTILFNPLVDSFVFAPAVFHTYLGAGNAQVLDPGIIGDSGWNNSLLYSSPGFGGLTFNVIYGLGEKAGDASQHKWGGNVMYFSGAFAATLAFQQVKFDSTPGDIANASNPFLAGFRKQTAVQGGLSYDFGVAKLFAQVQYIRTDVNNNPNGDIRHSNGQVGASVPVGAGSLLVSYAHGRTENAQNGFRRNTAAVGYDYNLSRRTDVYLAYFYDRIQGLSHGDTFGAGVRHRF
ncbi:porin [Cupriavidus alkaliphilus]|uniref:porin n=1 Tax=Cupriavidus alkaliphilus TaxID=942866 RepID=UPI00161A8A75|nr:porin [Cupriavidus alkaliphilus]